jgi:hypothetical protein
VAHGVAGCTLHDTRLKQSGFELSYPDYQTGYAQLMPPRAI